MASIAVSTRHHSCMQHITSVMLSHQDIIQKMSGVLNRDASKLSCICSFAPKHVWDYGMMCRVELQKQVVIVIAFANAMPGQKSSPQNQILQNIHIEVSQNQELFSGINTLKYLVQEAVECILYSRISLLVLVHTY